jgi:hypothetical protein
MTGIYDGYRRIWLDKCEGLKCLFWDPSLSHKSRWTTNWYHKEKTYCFRAYKKCGIFSEAEAQAQQ